MYVPSRNTWACAQLSLMKKLDRDINMGNRGKNWQDRGLRRCKVDCKM